MSKIKFTYNKVYNYVTNTHPIKMFFDALVVGLSGIFVVGWTMMCYHIFINGNTPNFGIY